MSLRAKPFIPRRLVRYAVVARLTGASIKIPKECHLVGRVRTQFAIEKSIVAAEDKAIALVEAASYDVVGLALQPDRSQPFVTRPIDNPIHQRASQSSSAK